MAHVPSNGKHGARASYAFWLPEHKELSKADRVPESQPQTNNRGELLGILKGIEEVANHFPPSEIELQIYTDSTYSKNCLTIWIPAWIERNWMTTANKPVLNRDIIEATVNKLASFQSYTITYVQAHTGKDDYLSRNNHIVDRMAVKVLNPETDEPVKVVTTNTQVFLEGCPLQLMGPPVSEPALVRWCRANLEKLDKDALETALLTALSKTAKKNGYNLEKQRLHRTSDYRLVSNHLITEGTHIVKEE
jgi:ribonuclease HI